ncbi:MAG: glycosyltransferase family 25 protein [Pseudomonadota bacterium]
MRSFIIHLTRATARAKNVARLMEVLPEAEVMSAVDGQDPDFVARMSQVASNLHHPPYPFELNRAEIACFMSHRACWAEIAAGDAPFALIAEDDLAIDPVPFAAALDLAKEHANENSFIRLPAKAREKSSGAIVRQGGAAMFLPRTIGLQAVCQIVGRAAARRLLSASEEFDRPVDTTLQMHWITGQRIHTILPNGISEMGAPSTIQNKTRVGDLLTREFRRASYRALIRRKPQLG